jgi:hypothetical protein
VGNAGLCFLALHQDEDLLGALMLPCGVGSSTRQQIKENHRVWYIIEFACLENNMVFGRSCKGENTFMEIASGSYSM